MLSSSRATQPCNKRIRWLKLSLSGPPRGMTNALLYDWHGDERDSDSRYVGFALATVKLSTEAEAWKLKFKRPQTKNRDVSMMPPTCLLSDILFRPQHQPRSALIRHHGKFPRHSDLHKHHIYITAGYYYTRTTQSK